MSRIAKAALVVMGITLVILIYLLVVGNLKEWQRTTEIEKHTIPIRSERLAQYELPEIRDKMGLFLVQGGPYIHSGYQVDSIDFSSLRAKVVLDSGEILYNFHENTAHWSVSNWEGEELTPEEAKDILSSVFCEQSFIADWWRENVETCRNLEEIVRGLYVFERLFYIDALKCVIEVNIPNYNLQVSNSVHGVEYLIRHPKGVAKITHPNGKWQIFFGGTHGDVFEDEPFILKEGSIVLKEYDVVCLREAVASLAKESLRRVGIARETADVVDEERETM